MITRTARRATVAALACAAIFAPAVASAAPASSHRTESASPALVAGCETPGLVIWMNTNGNGAAGSIFYHLRFTNLSGHPCTLNGFPYMYAVDLGGHQVGHLAAFSSDVPHVVTLGNGKTAHAVLQVVDVLNFTKSSCHPVLAAGFKIFPPNQTRAKTVPFPFMACAKTKHVFLTVRPVVAGF